MKKNLQNEILKKFNMEENIPVATSMNQKKSFYKEDEAEKLYKSFINVFKFNKTSHLTCTKLVIEIHEL